MSKLIIIGLGGFLGAVLRYLLTGTFLKYSSSFPLGTLLVNILGSFFLGFLMTLATETLSFPPIWRLFLAVGFLGAFTTFSTFAYETNTLFMESSWFLGVLNVALNVILGLGSLRIGEWLAFKIFL